jgi:general secretion pathway protein F
MRFLVRHVQPGGTTVTQETLDAVSAAEARRLLETAGSRVLQVQVQEQRQRMAGVGQGAAFEVAWWCRELETLVRAGMTAVEAIETLAAGHAQGDRAAVHQALLKGLREGATLSKAMRAAGVFPEVLVAGVTACERTSTLADALRDFLRYDELLQRLRKQAVSAALYPVMVVGLGAVISLFLLLYVIPRFSRLYGDAERSVSPVTEFVLALSRTLQTQGPLLVVALLVVVVAGVAAWRSARLALWAAAALEVIEPLRLQWDQFRLAKLYQSLALLVRGGYNFDEALLVCSALRLGPRMTTQLAVAREAIARGKAASPAMASASLTDTTTERLLAVGERTGAFGTVLQTVAERHANHFTTFIERATRIVEPVLLLAVALVVGTLVVMMYMPIFDIAGGVGAAR